jgi:hypothetical protein
VPSRLPPAWQSELHIKRWKDQQRNEHPEAAKENLLPSQLASTSFMLFRWADELALTLEQVVKPSPTKGGEAETTAK